MADKIPLSVAKTVDRYNPFASLLEGLARGLTTYLQTRYELDAGRAAAQREQQKIDIQRSQLDETIRANKAGEARTAEMDTFRARLEAMGLDAAARDVAHQRELLRLQGQLQDATNQGKEATNRMAMGVVTQALDLENMAAQQEAQGNLEAAASLRGQATNFYNLARQWFPELNVPTSADRRRMGFVNAGFTPEEVEALMWVDENDASPEDRMVIAQNFPRIRGALLPPGFMMGEEVRAEAEKGVKPTETPLTAAGRQIGPAVGQAISGQAPVIPGTPAAMGSAIMRGGAAVVGGIGSLFKGQPKAPDVYQEQLRKREEELQKRNRELTGSQ